MIREIPNTRTKEGGRRRITRRRLLLASAASFLAGSAAPRSTRAQVSAVASFSYPIGFAGRTLGDGFLVRHGYATENTWYLPGYWHAGEDWYALVGDTGGAGVYAIGDGEVVFAGSEYPGRVVIVRHADDLYSMYGHLDYDLIVAEGESVERGQPLGVVLTRTDGRAESHLHFEVRTFLTTTEVNGDAPRYPFACGPGCAPGPGYWPIAAPDLPTDQGWRNPTHVIGGGSARVATEAVVASRPSSARASIWSAPLGDGDARQVDELDLTSGDRYRLLDVRSGPAETRETSAEAYRLWYEIALGAADSGWVQAAVPTTSDTGSDGRPSSIRFDLLPTVVAPPLGV